MTDQVAEVRSFNRFWTAKIGVLQAGLLDSPYTPTEARVIFELAQVDTLDLVELKKLIGIDAGYMSRILARLKGEGILETSVSLDDARKLIVSLTDEGRRAFGELDRRSATEVNDMLARLSPEDRDRAVASMRTIRSVFDETEAGPAYVIRPLRPGDLGWVVQRHGIIYAEEYGWDLTFEGLVARIVADYVDNFEPKRESAWIAEIDGDPVACVFCVRRDEETAQLRMLLVDAKARGHGIGSRLVDECIRFARRAGYRKMMLWTNDVLVSARRIYEAAGFHLVHEGAHHAFGHDLVEQTWELDLHQSST
jgi:DNA-binding MarR family transcriptional regulator/GNAT superfamily N-acetyltransferase